MLKESSGTCSGNMDFRPRDEGYLGIGCVGNGFASARPHVGALSRTVTAFYDFVRREDHNECGFINSIVDTLKARS